MDPNLKETYPVKALPGYTGYFTYTVHFQNTGTASAINVRILDTLNNKLDLSTFQVINYSHANSISLNRNILTIRYSNILLPDSASNPEASKGFVQYRIKPKSNLPVGTQITNTALIYFDYNAPVVTNTTINFFDLTGIAELSTHELFNVYPNPTKNNITIETYGSFTKSSITIYDITGRKVMEKELLQNKTGIEISRLASGVYYLRLTNDNSVAGSKFIKH